MSAPAQETVSIDPAEGAEDMALVRELFVEYADWLDFDLCFQGFDLFGGWANPEMVTIVP